MIEVYGKSGCKQCDRAKDILKRNNINYVYYDLSLPENRKERQNYRENRWQLLPVIVIDNYIEFEGEPVEELIIGTINDERKE